MGAGASPELPATEVDDARAEALAKARLEAPVNIATAQGTLARLWPTILATVERHADGAPVGGAAVDRAEALAAGAARRADLARQCV